MAYLTYEEYEEYGGTLEENEFTLAEFKARKQIDYWTDSRVAAMATVPQAVKLCMIALIKHDSKYGAEAQADSPIVASFNNDGYSESYGGITEQAEAAQKAVNSEIRQLLYGETDDNGVPLLYRGLYT